MPAVGQRSPVPQPRLQPLPHRGQLSLAPHDVVALNQPQHVLQHHLALLRKHQASALDVSRLVLRGGGEESRGGEPLENQAALTLRESTVSGNVPSDCVGADRQTEARGQSLGRWRGSQAGGTARFRPAATHLESASPRMR